MSMRRIALLWICLLLACRSLSAQDLDADGILDECEASGEAAGIIVALAACSVLKNKCPPPPSTLARSQLDLLPDELVFKALRKTCGKLFTGSCKSKAVDRAIEKDPKCAAILFNGPGAGNPDCADFDAAIDIFTDLLETCQSTPNDLPEALRDSSDGPRRNPDVEKCESDGYAHGKSLAPSACATVLENCTSKKRDIESFKERLPEAEGTPSVNTTVCNKMQEIGCERGLSDAAMSDEECSDLLINGPDPGTSECQDFDASTDLFIKELDLCKVNTNASDPSSSDFDPCKCFQDGTVLPNGVEIPFSGCNKICYMEFGDQCPDGRKSSNWDVYYRLC